MIKWLKDFFKDMESELIGFMIGAMFTFGISATYYIKNLRCVTPPTVDKCKNLINTYHSPRFNGVSK